MRNLAPAFTANLTFAAIVSTVLTWLAATATAHEIRPAVADVIVDDTTLTFIVDAPVEAMLAGVDLSRFADTNDAPADQADAYDRFRAMLPPQLEAELRQAWPQLGEGFSFRAGDTALLPDLMEVDIAFEDDPDLARDTRLTLTAALPDDGTPITVAWSAGFGPLVVRHITDPPVDTAYSGFLNPGDRSAPIPREGALTETTVEVLTKFVWQGILHIVPKGLDHILFVLGLFFFSLKVAPLLWQVSAFTLAHTVTLAMASLGVVTVSPAIVEPLIAASIVYVAVENIIRPQLGWARIVIVFGFGLLHGLGFASVLGDLDLSPARLVIGLIGFNIGVEIGQLLVIAAAFLCVGIWFGNKSWYRAVIAIPASVAIAAIGGYWVVERTLL